jgi:murein DD-endopeptidase MepM/ murein hydrolase activator NlpD
MRGVAILLMVAVSVVAIISPWLGGTMLFLGQGAGAAGCAPAADAKAGGAPETAEGFDKEQLANAAAIVASAKELGLPLAAQVLGVQCSIGESGLRILPHGDTAGPDSRGLFQQRDNGAWGSLSDRMDAHVSSLNFFKALSRVQGWESLPASRAINKVQGNQDPDHYTPYRAQAESVVGAVTGAPVGQGAAVCSPGGTVVGDLSGKWVHPLPGAVMTSGYGPRQAPAGTAGGVLAGFHYGIDFSTPGGSPDEGGTVLAVTDLKIVVATDVDGGTGAGTHVKGQTLDGKLTVCFYHMVPGSLKVKAGDVVGAGSGLGTEGRSGNVTGRHCHIEMFLGAHPDPWVPDFQTTDPGPVLRSKGVNF